MIQNTICFHCKIQRRYGLMVFQCLMSDVLLLWLPGFKESEVKSTVDGLLQVMGGWRCWRQFLGKVF